jgi:2-dehydropantoate 2-reductase
MTTVVVTGAGGIGSAIAGHLARAGVDVVLLGRSAPHIDAIRRHGLLMATIDGSTETIPLDAVTEARGGGRAEHVIIATKTFDTAGAAEASRPYVGTGTWVTTVQNGLLSDAVLAEAFGAERVLPGLTTVGAERTEPGTVAISTLTARGNSLTQVGPARVPGASLEGAEHLAALMGPAGLPVEATADIDGAIWAKVALAGMGPVSALLQATVAACWRDPDTRAVIEAMHDEAVAVAAADGTAVDRDRSWAKAVVTYQGTGEHYPSMATDIRLGRRTEIGAISGAVVDRAGRHGIPTPVTATVVRLVKAAEALRAP